MREEASLRMFFKKVNALKQKIEIDDQIHLKKKKFRAIMRKEKLL